MLTIRNTGTDQIDHNNDGSVVAYGILKRIPGQWHGPVSTTAQAGSFCHWYVDFRAKDERAYTEFRSKRNSFVMGVYANKSNQVSPLELHTRWKARLDGRAAAEKVPGGEKCHRQDVD
jgi:hypothetical protein